VENALNVHASTTMNAMSNQESPESTENAGAGVGVDDLPELMREMFLQCVADACAAVDPAANFDGFIEDLWQQTSAAFGLVRRDWLADAPQPWPALLDEQRGVAEAVLEGRLRPDDLPS
jgi:hypothetical protein